MTVNYPQIDDTVVSESDMSNDDTILFKTMVAVDADPSLQRLGSTLHLSDSSSSNQNVHHGPSPHYAGNLASAATNAMAFSAGKYASQSQSLPQQQRPWSVEPTRLHMNPYDDEGSVRVFTITNRMKDTQAFEVAAEVDRLFDIRPNSGNIRSGEQISVTVRIRQQPIPADDLYLGVYFENEKIDILVDVDRSHDLLLGGRRRF